MKGRFAWVLAALALAPTASSFCGFYVTQERGSLFNDSSVVVLTRKGDHTVLTMANDYAGDPEAFGVVVPVPQVIEPSMVGVGDKSAIDALDQYSVPRLTEYFDASPCAPPSTLSPEFLARIPAGRSYQSAVETVTGVRVERQYHVEEYAITVIRADDGAMLARWLTSRGYGVPEGAASVLDSYIRQNMHFFLAKIDLGAQADLGIKWPRPLRISYDSPKFVLPLRLGTLNARGQQDLVVLALTERGRIETTNYRTARMTTDVDVPEWMSRKGKFGPFYRAAFDHRLERDGLGTAYLEYAWPLFQGCDPCSGPMVDRDALTALGADDLTNPYLTRIHVRYDQAHFPEDLVFQETADRAPWQVVFHVRHAFAGEMTCDGADAYREKVELREIAAERETEYLTGWTEADLADRRR